MPTSVGMTDGVNRTVGIDAGWCCSNEPDDYRQAEAALCDAIGAGLRIPARVSGDDGDEWRP
jgi:hypothetical protein